MHLAWQAGLSFSAAKQISISQQEMSVSDLSKLMGEGENNKKDGMAQVLIPEGGLHSSSR